MSRITLAQAAAWCGGYVEDKYADVAFFGANIDSRKILREQLFVALEGERDGHDFILMAMERGAAAVLCTRPQADVPAIVVKDTRLALGDIAREARKAMDMKVVGVTGSVGKSTTKEMIAAVLEGSFRVEKTPANQNNDLGLPMAILAMPEDTQVAVLEMGMNHFREIAYLTGIARPDLAVIINIGTMHIEHLGSKEGILRAKLEILEGMTPGSSVIFNGDDALLWGQRENPDFRVCCFGRNNPGCAVRGEDICQEAGTIRFWVSTGQRSFPVELGLEGEHYISDALAAVAVGLEMGVEPVQIQERLAMFRNMSGRQEIYQRGGYTIINDCYNAGPESMAAALEVLGRREGRHVAVLGDMLELGACTQAEHYRIGRIAAEKAEILLVYGPNGPRVLSGAFTGGMSDTKAMAFSDRDRLVATLKRMAKPGDVLLFKGSRGMRMELILEAFLDQDT